MKNKKTPLRSIRKMCLDCQETTTDVKNCMHTDCVLWQFRMGKGRPRLKDIRKYCLWCMLEDKNEVKLCPVTECPLFPYRMSKNPARKGIGATKEVMSKLRGSRASKGLKKTTQSHS